MSNYTKTTDFEAKDSLPTGDAEKIIRGADFETEFDNIATAIATKADTAGPTFTGTLTFETISDGTIAVTAFVDEDDMSSNSATLVPTQQSVKAYVDAQTTAQDLDFQADSGGALSIDLDSETMTFTGGTGITTTGSGNDVSFAVDNTVVATLTDSQTLQNKTLHLPVINQISNLGTVTIPGGTDVLVARTSTDTLTNKTLTSPDINTPDIDGGTIDGTVIGGTTAAAGSFTTVSATGNITVGGTVDGRDVATDGSKLDGIEASADVTDTANVTAAGALMDSELTSEASVKALNQGVATTDSPTFAGVTVNGNVEFDGLSGTGSVTVTDILDQDDMSGNSATALATQQSIKAYVDSQVATADTLSEVLANGNTTGGTDIQFSAGDNITNASGDFTIDIAGDIVLDADGADVIFADGGTQYGFIGNSSSDMVIKSQVQDKDLIFKGNDGGSTITALTLNMSEAGEASFNSDILLGEAKVLRFGTDQDFRISFDGSSGLLQNVTSDSDIVFKGSDGGSTITALTLDMSNAGKALFNAGATFGSGIDVTGTVTADGLEVEAATPVLEIDSTTAANLATLQFTTAGTVDSKITHQASTGTMTIDSGRNATWGGEIVFVTDTDTRMQIASNGDISFYNDAGTSQDLYWDASTSRLGLGTTSPSRALEISSGHIRLSDDYKVEWGGGTNYVSGSNANNRLIFATNNSERMRIDSSGRVGIGATSLSNKLTVNGDQVLLANGELKFADATNNQVSTIRNSGGASTSQLEFLTASTERMRIDSSGNVGIGASNVDQLLHLEKSSGTTIVKTEVGSGSTVGFEIAKTGATTQSWRIVDGATVNGVLEFYDLTNTATRMAINGSGNVGIGTTSPSRGLHVSTSSVFPARIESSTTDSRMEFVTSGGTTSIGGFNGNLVFFDSSAERMRITSGNLLVGKTSSAFGTAGTELQADGAVTITRNGSTGGTPFFVNRLANDGELAAFYKDGTQVGYIGTSGNDMYLGNGITGVMFNDANNAILPWRTNQLDDANISIGLSSYRFKDIYASNGTIQTSDRNEKQDIEELTEAEQRVAVACKGLLRKYRWKSAVEEKGDDARIHFGIIAQDLQDAFTAEGLDAGRYGMFINSTWTDEETGEERSRMGVRYSELLAFIISAI